MARLEHDLHIIQNLEGLNQKKEIGSGSFGAVFEVKLNGLPCIAKGLHDILLGLGGNYRVGDVEHQSIKKKFRDECILLSKLKHPNIVQFLGVHLTKDNEFLVMEHMHMDLQQCLKKYQNITLPIKLSILLDVSYGLLHLHALNPPVIHRDLSAANILLTPDMKAKIADLGVSKVFDLQQIQRAAMELTIAPGTLAYMPPEALREKPQYDFKLDIFSFGVLSLYTANQEFPIVQDPLIPLEIAANQVQHIYRRKQWIDKMGVDNPLYPVVIQCLQDSSKARPTTQQLNGTISDLCKKYKKKWSNVLELEVQLEEELHKEKQEGQKMEENLQRELLDTKQEINALQKQLKELTEKHKSLSGIEKLLEAKDLELLRANERVRNTEQRMLALKHNLESETTKIHTGFTGDLGNGIMTRLEATQDVWLERGDVNYSTHAVKCVLVGNHFGYPKKRFLIQFENLPAKCKTVKFAKMYLFFYYAHKASFDTVQESPDIPRTLRVHQVKKEWSETGATSAVRLRSVPWSAPYLSLDGGDADSKFQDEVTVYSGRPSGYIEFDITEAVRNWRKGDPNYGLLVVARNEQEVGRDLRFFSRKHSDQSKHPFVNLLCDY